MKAIILRIILVVSLLYSPLYVGMSEAATEAEKKIDALLVKHKNNTPMLTRILKTFPKGADLHNHINGSYYLKNQIIKAIAEQETPSKPNDKSIYYDKQLMKLITKDMPKDKDAIDKDRYMTFKDFVIAKPLSIDQGGKESNDSLDVKKFLDIASMRGHYPGVTNGADHFFSTFFHSDVPRRDNNEKFVEILEEIFIRASNTLK